MRLFKWRHRNEIGLKDSQLLLFKWLGLKIILNKYVDLSNSTRHSHRQSFISFILWGGYEEAICNENGSLKYFDHPMAPWVIYREKSMIHQINNIGVCWTLQIFFGKESERVIMKRYRLI